MRDSAPEVTNHVKQYSTINAMLLKAPPTKRSIWNKKTCVGAFRSAILCVKPIVMSFHISCAMLTFKYLMSEESGRSIVWGVSQRDRTTLTIPKT